MIVNIELDDGLKSYRIEFSGTTPSSNAMFALCAHVQGRQEPATVTRANAWRGLYWFPHGIQSFSPSFAHVSHFRQFSASCAFASSSGRLEKFLSPSPHESDSVTARGHGRMER